MAITKDSGRQYPLVAVVDFTYEDLTSGSRVDAVEVPDGAVVIGGEVIVDTAFNTAGGTTPADTVDVGDADSATRYATDLDLRTTGRKAITPTGHKYTGTKQIGLTWAQNSDHTTDPTAGAGRLLVHYVIEDRGNENQG